jgi:hypothetical protein
MKKQVFDKKEKSILELDKLFKGVGKDGNLYLRAMLHSIYTAKFEQKITFTTHKSVLLMEQQ